MIQRAGRTIINTINSPKMTNWASSPNMARNMIAALIVSNGVLRAGACELDTTAKPAARHYGAAVEGLHNAFALVVQFATLPFFAIGGLLLGKHVMAKSAFAKMGQTPIVAKSAGQAAKKANNIFKQACSKVGGFFSGMYTKAGKACKISNVLEEIKNINTHNTRVMREVRKKLHPDPKKDGQVLELIVKDGNEYFRVNELVKESKEAGTLRNRVKNFFKSTKKDNIMDALEGKREVLTPIAEIEAKQLEKNGTHFISDTLKRINGDKIDHNNIIGSQKFGEAIGMAVALTVISPIMTNKYVPKILEKLGLSKDKEGNKAIPAKYLSPKVKELRQDYLDIKPLKS